MLRNRLSSCGCFILVYSVTSRRDRRELVWDGMGGHVQMSWAECQRVVLLRAVGQRIQSAVAWSLAWVWGFLSIFSNKSMHAAPWPGCGGAFFLFILHEKAPLPSAWGSLWSGTPPPPYSCLWLWGHLQPRNSCELFKPGLEMKESRVSAIPPPGQWSGSLEPLGVVILPGFISESLCVCMCVNRL